MSDDTKQLAKQIEFDFGDPALHKKFNLTISTTDEMKIAIWSPLTKITKQSNIYKSFEKNGRRREVATKLGAIEKMVVSGNLLDQTHKSVIDTIMSIGSELKPNKEGEYVVYFSRYKLLEELGAGDNNYRWINKKIEQIQNSSIELVVSPDGETKKSVRFNIIHSVYEDEETGRYGIILNKSYIKYFANNLTMDYSKYLKDINQISGDGAGLIQAVIRFLIAQDVRDKPYVVNLNTLLEKVGYEITDRSFRSAVTAFNKNKVMLTEKFNTEFKSKERIIVYRGVENLFFSPSLFDQKRRAKEIGDR